MPNAAKARISQGNIFDKVESFASIPKFNVLFDIRPFVRTNG